MRFIDPIKALADYALPISAASLLHIITNFAAMLMVAHLGQTQLGASALGMSTYITVMTIVSTTLYAISILVSHAKGDKRSAHSIGKIVINGLWLALLMFIPSGLLLWHADSILSYCGQDPHLIQIIRPYFHYAALSLLPMLLTGVIAQFYTGIGQPRFAMHVSLIRLPFIILLSYGMILGRLGMPKMGLAGAMCASWLAQSVFTIGLFVYLFQNKALRPYHLFRKHCSPNLKILKKIFVLGIPIGLQFGGELSAMTAASYLMGIFGISTLAANQIVSQYSMFVVMIILGLSQAVSVLISHAYAQKDLTLIKTHFQACILLYAGIFLIVVMIFLGLPTHLISLYIDIHDYRNHNIVQLTHYLFEVACLFLLFDGTRHIFAGALRGLHDSSAPMTIGIISLWFVSLPASYLIGFHFHEGPVGLRLGFIIGFIVASVLLSSRLYKRIASEASLLPAIN